MISEPAPSAPGKGTQDLVFLLDVDNTLLDNDALKAEIGSRIRALVGRELADRFWDLYEEVRQEKDYVDYPETVSRFIGQYGAAARGAELRAIFDSLPFSRFLYPGVLETIRHLWTLGTVAILSDGDPVFQPQKIKKSGLEDAVKGNVMIFVHKELQLSDVFARYPANHYVIVDDKARILSWLEAKAPATFTTVFVLQGHYAQEGEFQPPPDIAIAHISDLARSRKGTLSAHPPTELRLVERYGLWLNAQKPERCDDQECTCQVRSETQITNPGKIPAQYFGERLRSQHSDQHHEPVAQNAPAKTPTEKLIHQRNRERDHDCKDQPGRNCHCAFVRR